MKHTVLIVDDSYTNNLLFSNVLINNGKEAKVTYNASNALEYLEDNNPDIIILDIMMPGINGLEFLKILKKQNIKIPVIVISSNNNNKTKEKAMRLGAKDYLTKPVDLEEMMHKININIA